MKALDRIAKKLGYVPNKGVRMARRRFDAAASDRLTASWILSDSSINSELYRSLRILRARSRDLFSNNEYARQFGNIARSNVVGPNGFAFRSRKRDRNNPDQFDRNDNQAIEARYRDFSKKGAFDVTTRLSRQLSESLALEALVRDGEFLIRKRVGSKYPQGFALQHIDIDRLDIDKNEDLDLTTGNRVIMGVEVDADLAPQAYWLLTQHPNGIFDTTTGQRHVRVPADEIIHGFIPFRAEQVRGFPWLHAAMVALWDTGGWREAAIINARIGANKLGFVKTDLPSESDAMVTDVTDVGERLNDSEPGEWHVIPTDSEVDAFDPTYPHAMFKEFNQAMLRGIASGAGVAHFSLDNDLETINFSSAKIGLMPERDLWMWMQRLMIDMYPASYYEDWLRMQLAMSAINAIPSTPESLERSNFPTWKGRRWQSAEPLKDAQANSLNIGMRTVSPRRLMEEQGLDPDEEWSVMAEDMEMLENLGIPVTLPTAVYVQEDEQDETGGTTRASHPPRVRDRARNDRRGKSNGRASL